MPIDQITVIKALALAFFLALWIAITVLAVRRHRCQDERNARLPLEDGETRLPFGEIDNG